MTTAPGELRRRRHATERFNLITWIRKTAQAWAEVPWHNTDPGEDPRLLFSLDRLEFGTKGGLWPITSTDRGETIFLAPGTNAPWLLIEDGEGGWSQHRMSFVEWLYRYLTGEDMAGPNSSAFHPGPVQLQRLPMTAAERPESQQGPDRGM
ncbi:SMI1/KNR4 family protein [Streptomyces sp. NPDC056501]|uniref:SMI1/KNR4 family protein n=1 Tax=Streptomyces sp. NPDC056501 TaxID=3345841 RepID=UPI00368EE4BF